MIWNDQVFLKWIMIWPDWMEVKKNMSREPTEKSKLLRQNRRIPAAGNGHWLTLEP